MLGLSRESVESAVEATPSGVPDGTRGTENEKRQIRTVPRRHVPIWVWCSSLPYIRLYIPISISSLHQILSLHFHSSFLFLYTRGVSWSLPVFSIKKTLNSQGNLKNFLFKVLIIGFCTFCPSFKQIMDTIPKTLFLFQAKPFDEPFFDFFKISEALLCEWVSHRYEKVIVGRGEVWRVRRVR